MLCYVLTMTWDSTLKFNISGEKCIFTMAALDIKNEQAREEDNQEDNHDEQQDE